MLVWILVLQDNLQNGFEDSIDNHMELEQVDIVGNNNTL